MTAITVIGAGPAGSSAAITALAEGKPVRLIEKSRHPRHKVCGEFLSPEIAPLLERLGVWNDFLAQDPARIRRLILHFPNREKCSRLPEPGYGLSRYRFDQLLYEKAVRLGAEPQPSAYGNGGSLIVASGRNGFARGDRLFGFKAHFLGPVDDAVELFFFSGCYVGVSVVEDGATNVCGIAPESLPRAHGFDLDSFLETSGALRARLRPLSRSMRWLTTGPLVFRHGFAEPAEPGRYLAGDALSFVDPFTGTGLVAAVLTGSSAGLAAARHLAPLLHLKRCRRALQRPFEVAGLFRRVLASGWAERLAGLAPGPLLLRVTRPRT